MPTPTPTPAPDPSRPVGGAAGARGPVTAVYALPTVGGVAVNARVAFGRATLMLPAALVTELIEEADGELVFDLSALGEITSVLVSRTALARFADAGLDIRIVTFAGNIDISPATGEQIVEWAPASHLRILIEVDDAGNVDFVPASGLERLVGVLGGGAVQLPPAPAVEEEDDEEEDSDE